MRDIRFLLKTYYSNSRALIIGIDAYKSVSPLSYAVSDAKEIRDILIEELGFPSDNVTYLTDSEATRQNIFRSFLALASSEVGIDDRILVFFAGHGHTLTGIRGEIGYLVPHDADINDVSSLIRWDDLTRNAELIRAKHMLFIMDACYGGLALTRSITSGGTRFLKDMMLRYSRQVLTAGKADEVVADAGGPLPEHSVFTGHLIEALRGKAATENGVLTASGVMAYVYNKVANDRNSNQTPHFGYFDGDGDFILKAPNIFTHEEAQQTDQDSLIVIPYSDEEPTRESTYDKIKKVKNLLANDASSIELHDFVIDEVRHFLSVTSEDHFTVQDQFSKEELLDRISKYETAVSDLSITLACIGYWARPIHFPIIQKAFARSTDRLETQGGLVIWLSLRLYPQIVAFYSSGIAAIEGKRYDTLASIFYTPVAYGGRRNQSEYLIDLITEGVLELTQAEVFKQIPGHERQYTPMSEYLYKTLQPRLDDTLFLGKGYEDSFDEFEVLYSLAAIDLGTQRDQYAWGPLGRFGWKAKHRDRTALSNLINRANAAGDNWEPIKAGLFGGKLARFNTAADALKNTVEKLPWY